MNRSIGVLHRLASSHRAETADDVARALVALHSSDPASVHLAVAARTAGGGAPVEAVDRALYDDRTLVLVMGMRRTLWVVHAEAVPVVAAACGRRVAADERRKLVRAIEAQGVAHHGDAFVDELEEQALTALAARGGAGSRELADDVPALRATVRFGGSSKWAADVPLSSRIVLLLTCEGRIVRMRPLGGWTSTRHRYGVAQSIAQPMDEVEAQAQLARRWLSAFGPQSADVVGDLKWWTGWSVAVTKRALAGAGEWKAPAQLPMDTSEPWVALVPGLDPTTMGWKERSWYLGEFGPQLFDRNGNAGPAIWMSGRIVGGWAQRATGEVVTRLLLDVGRDGAAAVEAEAARMRAWLDASGAVVTPRFPTPLQRELSK